MTGTQLAYERKKKGWTQKEASSMLSVSQPYLSLLEKDRRRMTCSLAVKVTEVYELSPTKLPLNSRSNSVQPSDENDLTDDLVMLGYPGYSYLNKSSSKKNPAEVLASALQVGNLDSRLIEALPWVLLTFPDLDWEWLAGAAKMKDAQNRLGFVTSVARRLAQKQGETDKAAQLAEHEASLESSRLMRDEDTLCHDSLTLAERRWLRDSRPEEAKHWGLLTDLSPEHLSYAH